MSDQSACRGCGAAVARGAELYTSAAEIVCAKCFAAADIVETDIRHARRIRRLGFSALGLGMASFFMPAVGAMMGRSGALLVVAACATAAFVSGIVAILNLGPGHERFTKHLSRGDKNMVWVCSIAGMVLAGVFTLAALMGYAFPFRGL